jgi:ligand-binding sensor domain-containing protein
MKKLNFFYLLFLLVLHLHSLDAFTQQHVFTEIPPPAGGFGASVVATQDTKGYMWFGGEGLYRYDGYSYKSYYNNPQDTSSLAYNRIAAVYADRKGFIWIGTTRKGLDKLDPETGIFTHYRHKPADKNSISNDTISAILEDRNGKIWVGTEHGGLNCLDPKTGINQRYIYDPTDTNSLSYNNVTALYEDPHGTIWVGTGFLWHDGSELNKLKKKEGGLNRFNPVRKNFTRYLHDPNNKGSLIDNRVRAIFEDSKDRFWVGTAGDGLHTMNKARGSFERHRYSAANPTALSRPPVKNTLHFVDDMISFIKEDAIGAVWIGTFTGGINRYDPKTGRVSFYSTLKAVPFDKSGFSNILSGSAISRDGVLWVTRHKGVFYLDPLQKEIPYYEVGRLVRSLLQDDAGRLWIGTDKGLNVYDSTRTSNAGSFDAVPKKLKTV